MSKASVKKETPSHRSRRSVAHVTPSHYTGLAKSALPSAKPYPEKLLEQNILEVVIKPNCNVVKVGASNMDVEQMNNSMHNHPSSQETVHVFEAVMEHALSSRKCIKKKIQKTQAIP